METNHKVYLIGGSSHTGKTSIAQSIASQLCWHFQSTENIAQHVNRPWQTPPKPVKRFVAYHYETLSGEQLVADLERHYNRNVWPTASELITTHACDHRQSHIVVEGAALLPDLVSQIDFENVAKIWLTAPDEVLRERIHKTSEYELKSSSEKLLIDKFVERTCRINHRITSKAETYSLTAVDTSNYSSLSDLERVVLRKLKSQGQAYRMEESFFQ
ncbi:MAG: hypothetical protein F6J92_32110 [Symploca sp. SIO1A3]|nr:hypothetical protein [Symploca sp. SIO1A3]